MHTVDKGLVYIIGQRPEAVSAYVDVVFSNEAARRSRYGFAVFMAGCLISCLSKCTTMVCLSTSEAEFVVATETAKDVVWDRGFLDELGFLTSVPSVIREDNQVCCHDCQPFCFVAKSPFYSENVVVHDGVITFAFVPSKRNIADIFTKVIPDVKG